jgi:hypothetical protein
MKIISKDLIEALLKNGSIKFEGLMSLPWFLEYIARDIPTAKIFYISNLGIIIPVLLIKKNLLKVAYVPSPPNLIREGLELSNFNFDLLKRISETIDYHILIARAHPYDKFSRFGLLLTKNCFLVKDRADLFLNLKRSITEIYYNFEKRTRYALRKSLGLKDTELLRKFAEDPYLRNVVYEESSEKGIQLFSKLLKYQFTKIALETGRKNSRELLRLYSYYSIENIKKVFTILGREGLIRLFFAQKDTSEPEAGVALFVSKKYLYSPMAYWWLGASTYLAEKKGLPTILQFSIINILKKEGYERYFLGGVGTDFRQVSSGPTLFKRGFTRDFKQGYLLIDVRGGFLNRLRFLSNPAIFRLIRHFVNL